MNWAAICKMSPHILFYDHFHMGQRFRYININHAIIRTTLVEFFYNLKVEKHF